MSEYDLFIEGWGSDEDISSSNYNEYLESDSESYSVFLEEPAQRRFQPSLADTQAAVALQIWSSMTDAEKNSQIATALQNEHQKVVFHRLPSNLNLTMV